MIIMMFLRDDNLTNEPFIIEEYDGKLVYSINRELTEEEFMEAYLAEFDKVSSFTFEDYCGVVFYVFDLSL